MATIQDAIALSDGVSPTLERIIRCSETMADTFQVAAFAANSMAQTVTGAAARSQAQLTAVEAAADAVTSGIESVSGAASRVDAAAMAAQLGQQFAAADMAIASTESGIRHVRAESQAAASGVNELATACNQIHAPPEAAESMADIGSAAQQAVERTREEIGVMSAFAMRAAQQIIELGVACDQVKISPATATNLLEVGNAAVQAADKTAGIGQEAQRATRSVEALERAAERLPEAFEAARDAMNTPMDGGVQAPQGFSDRIRGALGGMTGKFTMGTLAAEGIGKFIGMISEAPGNLTRLSDEYSGILARIKLVTGSQQQAAELNDQIYYAALRARGGYAEMADAVSKISMTAKEAFPDPKEAVPFMEGIQKLFKIGGTDAVRQKDAILQLTQALGSGRLQGDEFRSIAEAAPLIEQMVAKYMGVSQGELKELSSQGAITAQVMKNAILSSLDEIDERFSQIPKKWEDVWQQAKSETYRAFVPAFEQISQLANSPAIETLSGGMVAGARLGAAAVAGLINNLRWLAGVAQDVGMYLGTWLSAGLTVLEPVFEWLTALVLSYFMIYSICWLTVQAPLIAHIALLAVKAMWDILLTAYAWAQNAAMIAQNATLLVMYARMGIVTAATALWALVTQGLTGVLRLLNLTMLMNPIGFVIALVGAIIVAFGAWAIRTNGLRNTIADAFGFIAETAAIAINFMIRRVNDLIVLLNKAAQGINNVFGTSVATVELVEELDPEKYKKKTIDIVQNPGKYLPDFNFKIPGRDDTENPPAFGQIADSTNETAKNTKNMKEAMDITDEDIKYMRDAAEQNAINRYTTAEVKIEMGGIQNNVSSEMDLDGMVQYVSDGLFDAMVAGAEAVHS